MFEMGGSTTIGCFLMLGGVFRILWFFYDFGSTFRKANMESAIFLQKEDLLFKVPIFKFYVCFPGCFFGYLGSSLPLNFKPCFGQQKQLSWRVLVTLNFQVVFFVWESSQKVRVKLSFLLGFDDSVWRMNWQVRRFPSSDPSLCISYWTWWFSSQPCSFSGVYLLFSFSTLDFTLPETQQKHAVLNQTQRCEASCGQ